MADAGHVMRRTFMTVLLITIFNFVYVKTVVQYASLWFKELKLCMRIDTKSEDKIGHLNSPDFSQTLPIRVDNVKQVLNKITKTTF